MQSFRIGVAFVFVSLSSVRVYAEVVVVKASEIKMLLTGNTIVGKWNGADYRQFFHDDGTTIYATKNTRFSIGRWGVNYKLNTYESLWNEARWDSYHVMREGDELFWRDIDQTLYSFKILSGQQLVWPQ